MKLTYIIPTYNLPGRDIRRCLESLALQDMPRDDYEAIVVDDESDVSPEADVLAFSAVMNIKFFRQAHARQGAARNLGLQHASGDFIRFVDGDDFLPPHTTAPLLSLMEEHHLDVLLFSHQSLPPEEAESPLAPIPITGTIDTIETIGTIPSTAPSPPTKFPDEKAQKAPLDLRLYPSGKAYMASNTLFGSPCTLCFRRELRGSPTLRFAENTFIEDEEFVTRLVWRAGITGVTTLVAYNYVQRAGSTTHKQTPEHVDELFEAYFSAIDNLIRFMHTEPEPHTGLYRKIHYLSVDILRHALRQDDWKQRFARCSAQLRNRGLFPLPKAGYPWKYQAFRCLSSNRFTLWLLRLAEKSTHKST